MSSEHNGLGFWHCFFILLFFVLMAFNRAEVNARKRAPPQPQDKAVLAQPQHTAGHAQGKHTAVEAPPVQAMLTEHGGSSPRDFRHTDDLRSIPGDIQVPAGNV